jgi:hypothetical protein
LKYSQARPHAANDIPYNSQSFATFCEPSAPEVHGEVHILVLNPKPPIGRETFPDHLAGAVQGLPRGGRYPQLFFRLPAVQPEIANSWDADALLDVLSAPPADHGNSHARMPSETTHHGLDLSGHYGHFRPRDGRRDRSVVVEKDRPGARLAEPLRNLVPVRP